MEIWWRVVALWKGFREVGRVSAGASGWGGPHSFIRLLNRITRFNAIVEEEGQNGPLFLWRPSREC